MASLGLPEKPCLEENKSSRKGFQHQPRASTHTHTDNVQPHTVNPHTCANMHNTQTHSERKQKTKTPTPPTVTPSPVPCSLESLESPQKCKACYQTLWAGNWGWGVSMQNILEVLLATLGPTHHGSRTHASPAGLPTWPMMPSGAWSLWTET